MFKIKPRCKECGHRLKDGICVNPKCLVVMLREAEEKAKKKKEEEAKP